MTNEVTSRLFIVDTNVLVAGLITSQPSSPTAQVLDAMLDGRLFYLLSPALLREYRQVLLRPQLMRLHRNVWQFVMSMAAPLFQFARAKILAGARIAPDGA